MQYVSLFMRDNPSNSIRLKDRCCLLCLSFDSSSYNSLSFEGNGYRYSVVMFTFYVGFNAFVFVAQPGAKSLKD